MKIETEGDCKSDVASGCIYTRAKTKALPICCIVFNLCSYYSDSSSNKDQRKKLLLLSL